MSDEKKEEQPEVEQSTIPPNLPEGAYPDENGVWRDKDGNPIGGGAPEGGGGG